MLGFFSAKDEVCDVYWMRRRLHVLIMQPRVSNVDDPSNKAAGFLIFGDGRRKSFAQDKIEEGSPEYNLESLAEEIDRESHKDSSDYPNSYTPTIAVLSPAGVPNEILLSYLEDHPRINTGLVRAEELGCARHKRARRNMEQGGYKDLLAKTAQAYGISEDKSIATSLDLVSVSINGDNSTLDRTVSSLWQIELARQQTMAALRHVVDRFVVDRMEGFGSRKGRRVLKRQVERIIASPPL